MTTGTCIDALLPKGLTRKSTTLVLAEAEAQLRDLQLWADLAVESLKANKNEVREPGAIDWPTGEGSLVFFSEILQALNPTSQLSGYRGRPHKTALEQAVFLGAARLLYGTKKDAKDAGLDLTSEVVIEFVNGERNQTFLHLIRNDFDPKSKGKKKPFNFSEIPKVPETMWDILNEDDDED